MSVPSIDKLKKFYQPDGIVTQFFYQHQFEKKEDIKVVLLNTVTGVADTLLLDINYSIFAVNDDYTNGATITTTVAYDSDHEIIIQRVEEDSQDVDFTEGHIRQLRAMEDGLDKLTRLYQQLKDELCNTLRTPFYERPLGELPGILDRADKLLTFDSNGVPQTTVLDPSIGQQAKDSIQLVGNEFSLVNDEATPPANSHYGTDALSQRGYLANPVGPEQDALNGTRISSHVNIAAAIVDAQANNRPIIIDEITDIDNTTTIRQLAEVTDTSNPVAFGSPAQITNPTNQPITDGGFQFQINALLNPLSLAPTEPLGVGVDVIGIPVTSHNFVPGQLIVISGTTNNDYNDFYEVLGGTTPTHIHIKSPKLSNFKNTDEIRVCRSHTFQNLGTNKTGKDFINNNIDLNAIDEGAGLVSLPVIRNEAQKGQWISIRGCSVPEYNGEFKLQPGTFCDRIWILATYVPYTPTGNERYALNGTYARDRGWMQKIDKNLSNATAQSGAATRIRAKDHSFPAGQIITISNAVPATYNGTWTVQASSNQTWLDINKPFVSEVIEGGLVYVPKMTGIPVYNQDFDRKSKIRISGTTDYDGDWSCHYLTDRALQGFHEIVIETPYIEKEFTAGQIDRIYARVTTPVAHGFAKGDIISVENDATYNGTYTVLHVQSTTQFDIEIINNYSVSATDGEFDLAATFKKEIRTIRIVREVSDTLGFSSGFVSIRNTTSYNGRKRVIGFSKSNPGLGFDQFDINLAAPIEAIVGGNVRPVIVTIPNDVQLIFPDGQHYLRIMNNIQLVLDAKVIASDHQKIFGMFDDNEPFLERARVNFRNSGMTSSFVLHWGGRNVNDQSFAAETSDAVRHAWNTAFDSGCEVVFGRGTYLQSYPLIEDVNVEGITTNRLRGQSSRQTRWKQADYSNEPVLIMLTNNWHNSVWELMDVEGDIRFNNNMQPQTAMVYLEGFNWLVKDVHIHESAQWGIYVSGGQSNDCNFRGIESESNFWANLVIYAPTLVSVTFCSFEDSQLGLKFVPKLNSDRRTPNAQQPTVISNYFESNDIDIVMQGISAANIQTMRNGGGTNTRNIILRKDPYLNVPCRNIEIHGNQSTQLKLDVEDECGTGVTVWYPASKTINQIISDKTGDIARDRKGTIPYRCALINGLPQGQNFLDWSHPSFNLNPGIPNEPFGDGSNLWNGTTILPQRFGYLQKNLSGVEVNVVTRWETRAERNFLFINQPLNAGTYYFRFLGRINVAWNVQAQLRQGVSGVFYNWIHNEWISDDIDYPGNRFDLVFWDESEFVCLPPVSTSITRQFRMNLVFNDGEGQPAVLEYVDCVTMIDDPLIHKRNGEIIGYGFDENWVKKYFNTVGTKTLTYWDRDVHYDATAGAFQVNLPPNPEDDHTIDFVEVGNSTNNLTIDGNGKLVEGVVNVVFSTARQIKHLVFSADIDEWIVE